MMLVRKPFVIYLERKRLDNMWKVFVIICMVGYDCTGFQQSPIQFYHSYEECISVAIEKENLLILKYAENGYYITDSKATCKQHPII